MSTMICMWSGPRNLSTAMMRSFGARADCAVLDEPFFAPFLKATGKDHPGRAETLETHETDPKRVAALCGQAAPGGKGYYFQKHMPHHMLAEFPRGWMKEARHFFLIRDPSRVIVSYAKGREAFTLNDLGYKPQRDLFEYLTDMMGTPPPVMDSVDILRSPEVSLRALCGAINIPFDTAMLSWKPGSRLEDGAWAPYWYSSVENSSGFERPSTEKPSIPPKYETMLAACEADYAALHERRLRV